MSCVQVDRRAICGALRWDRTRACPQGHPGRSMWETDVGWTLSQEQQASAGARVGWGASNSQACWGEEERSFLWERWGQFIEQVLFKLDPWFSNLTAHQSHQSFLKNVPKSQSKPIKSELWSVIVYIFEGITGDSDEKLG